MLDSRRIVACHIESGDLPNRTKTFILSIHRKSNFWKLFPRYRMFDGGVSFRDIIFKQW